MDRINVTPHEAAQCLMTNRESIVKKLESGELPGYRDGTHWKIPYRLLISYAESRAIAEAKERALMHKEIEDA